MMLGCGGGGGTDASSSELKTEMVALLESVLFSQFPKRDAKLYGPFSGGVPETPLPILKMGRLL